MATSPEPGKCIMFRYLASRASPLSQAITPRATPTMAELPAARPSMPSVRLVPFEQARITTIIMIIYMPQEQ